MKDRKKFISKREKLYGISIIIFLIGICIGSIVANYINLIQKQELLQYMNEFFIRFPQEKISYFEVLKECIFTHGKTIIILWILGIGIIGIPFIIIILFIKGFSYGFTSAFLLVNYGWNGFLFSIVSCIPQNIILIPGLMFISAASINFAMSNYKNNQRYNKEKNKKWMEYGLVLLIGLLFVILTGIIETFISPLFMKIFMSNMSN
ncbi:stage II sporulation protein M [Defluviitalea phaphyphila]|uniref:stage II sporulation protein M n=1 Tax=Defluviitalea phaphyphila TaxID=1473580 RepID=UPI0007316E36|nr:stage II sporulation protein M [Defluviitalea phaphyphila]